MLKIFWKYFWIFLHIAEILCPVCSLTLRHCNKGTISIGTCMPTSGPNSQWKTLQWCQALKASKCPNLHSFQPSYKKECVFHNLHPSVPQQVNWGCLTVLLALDMACCYRVSALQAAVLGFKVRPGCGDGLMEESDSFQPHSRARRGFRQ